MVWRHIAIVISNCSRAGFHCHYMTKSFNFYAWSIVKFSLTLKEQFPFFTLSIGDLPVTQQIQLVHTEQMPETLRMTSLWVMTSFSLLPAIVQGGQVVSGKCTIARLDHDVIRSLWRHRFILDGRWSQYHHDVIRSLWRHMFILDSQWSQSHDDVIRWVWRRSCHCWQANHI
jgi:hypothetical protein